MGRKSASDMTLGSTTTAWPSSPCYYFSTALEKISLSVKPSVMIDGSGISRTTCPLEWCNNF
jgi:hypothetical protein